MLTLYRVGVLEWAWLAAGCACAAAAALAFGGRSWPRRPDPTRAAWAVFGAALPLLAVFFKLSQYLAHESMLDSAVMINLAWNAAHGYGLTSSFLGGVSYLSVHFAFAYALLSPVILVWPSAVPFFLLHALAVGSVPLCVYLLARRGGREELGWAAGLLAAGHPLVSGVLGTVLDNSSYALPLFLWAAYCWESGRRRGAVVLLLLMLSTRETIPFLFAGLAAYAWTRAGTGRARLWAAVALAGSAALWLGEMSVISHARAAAAVAFEYWGLFPSLGGTRAAVVESLWRRPWLAPAALVWPPAKLGHAASLLLSLAFLPLASGAALLPALAVWLPHQLADATSNFHRLIGHQGAYVAGPILWASVQGLKRLDSDLSAPRRKRLLAWVLVVAAAGFLSAGQFGLPPGALPSSWNETGPGAVAAVRDGDAVWCDTFFATHLATRRFVKALPLREDPSFTAGAFRPDSILLSRHWLGLAAPPVLAAVSGAIREGGLIPVFNEGDLIVFARPR